MQVVSRFIRAEASFSKMFPTGLVSNSFPSFAVDGGTKYLRNAASVTPLGKHGLRISTVRFHQMRGRRAFTAQSGSDQAPQTSYQDMDYQQPSSTIRRRPYNLEAKMRMKQYRRESMQRQRAQEIEDEERNFQIDWSKLYQKGDPGTVQGIVRDIITVGYFVKLPNGREGFLPSAQFGCSGGIPLLTRLFKVGDEVTVRVEKMNDGGKDKLYARKDESLGWAKMA